MVGTKQKPTTRGYVMLLIDGRWHPAHRLSYELAHGVTLPRSLVTDHLCRRKECRAPLHVEPCTQAENLRRSRVERRRQAAETSKVVA